MANASEIAESRAAQLPQPQRELFESFKGMGMTPAAAFFAAQGRASRSTVTQAPVREAGRPDLPKVEGIPLEEQRALWKMPLYKERVEQLGGDGPATEQAEREVFAVVKETQKWLALGEPNSVAVERGLQSVFGDS